MIPMGFTDEAADGITGQIRAARCLGWRHIEMRKLDGRMLWEVPDDAFERAADTLADAGVQVYCLGSGIANGAKRIDAPDPESLAEAQVLARRCRRLGTRFVRIMSWLLLDDQPLDRQLADERVRRLRDICAVLTDAGLVPVHENCCNWGALGPRFSRELCDRIPGLRLCFDIANPVRDRDGDGDLRPDGSQGRRCAWEFYRQVRDLIAHVHIKDARELADGTAVWCWPGEGHAQVERILSDLIRSGYAGGISIEPHLFAGPHRGLPPEEARFRTFVEYGHRSQALVGLVRARLAHEGLGFADPPA